MKRRRWQSKPSRRNSNVGRCIGRSNRTPPSRASMVPRDERSEKLVADLDKELPYDALLNQVELTEARALISLEHNQPAQAVGALDSAKPYELGAHRRVVGDFSAIHIRGEAFLHLRDGVKAAAEYQKILDHRGIDPTSPSYSLAHLGLGRAYALQGDTVKARTAYQDFFALWKDADPDVPVLKQAKAEYEKLK